MGPRPVARLGGSEPAISARRMFGVKQRSTSSIEGFAWLPSE